MLLWAFANERFEADVGSPRAAVAAPPAPTSSDGEADYGTKNPAAAPG